MPFHSLGKQTRWRWMTQKDRLISAIAAGDTQAEEEVLRIAVISAGGDEGW